MIGSRNGNRPARSWQGLPKQPSPLAWPRKQSAVDRQTDFAAFTYERGRRGCTLAASRTLEEPLQLKPVHRMSRYSTIVLLASANPRLNFADSLRPIGPIANSQRRWACARARYRAQNAVGAKHAVRVDSQGRRSPIRARSRQIIGKRIVAQQCELRKGAIVPVDGKSIEVIKAPQHVRVADRIDTPTLVCCISSGNRKAFIGGCAHRLIGTTRYSSGR